MPPATPLKAGPGKQPHERLQHLRCAAGYRFAAEAARAIGVGITTYSHPENGHRGISHRAAKVYGRFFGVTGGMILFGEVPATTADVPVIGAVAHAGRIVSRMQHLELLPETVPAPVQATEQMLALIVNSEGLYPAYRKGDIVFFAALNGVDPEQVHGRECVVELADGIRLLRMCHRTPDGNWTLTSYNAPPSFHVVLSAASPVLWVQLNNAPVTPAF